MCFCVLTLTYTLTHTYPRSARDNHRPRRFNAGRCLPYLVGVHPAVGGIGEQRKSRMCMEMSHAIAALTHKLDDFRKVVSAPLRALCHLFVRHCPIGSPLSCVDSKLYKRTHAFYLYNICSDVCRYKERLNTKSQV